MDMILFLYAVCTLFCACIGVGIMVMQPIRHLLPPLPIWLYTSAAYFLGQGILGSSLILLGLKGYFNPVIVQVTLITFTIPALIFLYFTRSQWLACIKRAFHVWFAGAFAWKGLAFCFVMFLIYGTGTFYGGVLSDAYAFYLALPKFIAASHTVAPLPGYETFCTIGYLAEILLAALYSMGLPDASPRCYSLINFVPAIVIFYGLARECTLGRKGALLAVIMITTSSAGTILWGTGKTDLFAVGPAAAAYFFSIVKWEETSRKASFFFVGIFTAFACVLKLSYIITLIPSIFVLCNWSSILEAFHALFEKKWLISFQSVLSLVKNNVLMSVGFLCGFWPHLWKNIVFNGSLLGSHDYGSFYSVATIIRLILSYPFALTYGTYWAQLGTISPLFLAFAPLVLFLPKPTVMKRSKLAAVSYATLIGLFFWIALFPSYFMPRYILATLFLLSIPIAAGADVVIRQKSLLASFIPIAVIVTLLTTASYTNNISRNDGGDTFNRIRISRFFSSGQKSFLYKDDFSYSLAHKAINSEAERNDRILMLTHYRLWLRPDLLQAVSTEDETRLVQNPKINIWQFIRVKKFSFILLEENIFNVNPKLFHYPPSNIQLKQIYKGVGGNGALIAYKVNIEGR